MHATLTISLPDDLRAFVEAQVARGGYASRDEYIQTLIRRDQHCAARRQLEAELAARSDDADSVVMDAADFRRMRKEFQQRT